MGVLFVMENNVHILIRRAYFDANDKRNSLRGSSFFLQELENCSIMKKSAYCRKCKREELNHWDQISECSGNAAV